MSVRRFSGGFAAAGIESVAQSTTVKLFSIVAAAVLASLLAGCGGGEPVVTDANGAKFVRHVRHWIPSTSAYSDEMLIDMAANVCRVGNEDDGVRILDNYSELEAEDYSAFAISALDYACPEEGGNGG